MTDYTRAEVEAYVREMAPTGKWAIEPQNVTIARQCLALMDRVEALEGALKTASWCLTETEAILGGEYGDHYGPLCEKMLELRNQIAALGGSHE